MYIVILLIFTSFITLAPPHTVRAETPHLEPARRDLRESEARHALRLLYQGRTESAATFIKGMEPTCGGQPLYLLTRARVTRERLPIDDDNKAVLTELTRPIHSDLDQVIAECTRRMESGDTNEDLLLLRGWAWMFKSHIKSFEHNFWSAGRDAKKGKRDLNRYLESNPNVPTAEGILGAFLYFADTIGTVTKFVSKLLFMPSGDRVEGLRLMTRAEAHPDASPDNIMLLNSILIMFEGRYEDGLAGFEKIRQKYPTYMPLVRAFPMMGPLIPEKAQAYRRIAVEVLNASDRQPSEEVEQSSYTLLRFMVAYSDRYYDPDRALRGFQKLVDESPDHPDWVAGFSAFEMSRILAMRGEYEEAGNLLRWLRTSNRNKYIHGDARSMLKALEHADFSPLVLHPATIARMYRGDIKSRDKIIEVVGALKDPPACDHFYLADALLLAGRADEAFASYDALLHRDVNDWDHSFQMIASSRIAEIHGARGEYKAAKKRLERGMKFYHREFLYDWILESRARYYDRLKNGDDMPPPRLFSSLE